MRLVLGDIFSWAMPTPLWSLLYSTIVLYEFILAIQDGELWITNIKMFYF